MPLSKQVPLGPGHIVLDGDPAPQNGHSCPPVFGPCLLWPNGLMDQDATCYTELGLGPVHIALDGYLAPPKGHSSPTIFGPCLWPNGWMDQDATCYGGGPSSAQVTLCEMGTHVSPCERDTADPHFLSMSIVVKVKRSITHLSYTAELLLMNCSVNSILLHVGEILCRMHVVLDFCSH